MLFHSYNVFKNSQITSSA